MTLKPLGYLAEVNEEGTQGPVNPISAVARIRHPHILHPLEKQQKHSKVHSKDQLGIQLSQLKHKYRLED